jgi:hypothetical protein
MPGFPNETVTAKRLSELRHAYPVDLTLRNLLDVVTLKLDVCARLAVYDYEASSEGHDCDAATFRELADAERRSVGEILGTLRRHLDQRDAGASEPAIR